MISRVWLFADYALPADPERYLPGLVELGVTDLVLALNRVDDERFRVGYDEERYIAYAEALASIGVDPHLMTWIRPDDAFVRDAADRLPELCRACAARSLLLDAEGPWIKAPGARHERAAATFFDRLGGVAFEVGVTGFTTLTQAVRPLVERADYGLPQGYSVWSDKTESTHWDAYAPGNKQRLAHGRWKDASRRVVMGLAAFWQRRPDMDQSTAMRVATDACEALGIEEVAYWSHKWLVGAHGDAERTSFIRSLACDARDGVERRSVLPHFFEALEAERPAIEAPPEAVEEQHIQDVRELRDGPPEPSYAPATIFVATEGLREEGLREEGLREEGLREEGLPLPEWLARAAFHNARGEAVLWREGDLPAVLRGARPDSLAFAALVAHLQGALEVTGDLPGVLGPATLGRLHRGADASQTPQFAEQADGYGARVVAVAARALGVRETGPNAGSQIAEFIRTGGGDPDDVPSWCMYFVHWCHHTAGAEMGGKTACPRTGGVAKGWRSAGETGLTRILPRAVLRGEATLEPGDVMVRARLGRPQDASRMRAERLVKGHAGVVERVDGRRVLTIEGNTDPTGSGDGDGVYRMGIDLDDPILVGFYRPAQKNR